MKVDLDYVGVEGDQEGMDLVSMEFIESNEKLPKDELKELLGINGRTFRYYKEIGFLKGTKTKRKGEYIFSPKDINFLSFIRDLRNVGLSLSEIKKIKGIYKIPNTNNRRQLLRLYELLKELFQKIEFEKKELEQLKKDILDFKDHVRNLEGCENGISESEWSKEAKFKTDFRSKSEHKDF